MIKKILLSSLAVGAIALGAPAAHAAVEADCGFETIAQEQLTGGQDTFTGVAYGYAVSNTPGASVSVWCEVEVAGSVPTGATTPPGAPGQASTTSGQVTFTAAEGESVKLCVVWTGDGGGRICSETTTTQIPPQPVIDLITEVTSIPDFLICPVFVTLGVTLNGGVPGVVDIAADGDIALGGIPFWDCPPYEV